MKQNYQLSEEQKKQFHEDGYLIIPDILDPEDCKQLLTRAHELLEELNPEKEPVFRFLAKNNDEKYFLESGDKIRYFYEKDAFDESGKLAVDKTKAVNKIGHALHELDPAFRKVSLNSTISNIARGVGMKEPRVLQSMLIFKQPRIGGVVPPHQDSTFLYTEPLSATGFWFALEDCTTTNGCLEFIPGSHKTTPITRRMKRDKEGTRTFIEGQDGEVDESRFVAGEVKAGTLVLIHGSVVHRSKHNYSDKSRYIYTFHCIDGTADYSEDNWLQPTKEMPFSAI
ncbi:uncharacterized protein VTP21DRAFT_1200 [Calcarisporiella thermophila]|uniref:uncharacterized protein n=1 Tax=Calcarisporiella thermophila TaxID=911321 RepID=UPI003743EAC7